MCQLYEYLACFYRRGWFPFSYTRMISEGESMKHLPVHKYVFFNSIEHAKANLV